MKALILAGGRGSRINEFSENVNKCMIPFLGKPLIEQSFAQLEDLSINDVVIVVGYKAEDIINCYGISHNGLKISYVIQTEQKGLVHAIECAQNALAGDDFILMLGDEVLANHRLRGMVELFNSDKDIFGVCGTLEVIDREQIKRTYSIVKDADDRIMRLIEKPKNPFNNFQGTGHCVFRNSLLNYIENTPIHPERDEKELPDLVQSCIDDGNIVKAFSVCDFYSNINSVEDLRHAEMMLRDIEKA